MSPSQHKAMKINILFGVFRSGTESSRPIGQIRATCLGAAKELLVSVVPNHKDFQLISYPSLPRSDRRRRWILQSKFLAEQAIDQRLTNTQQQYYDAIMMLQKDLGRFPNLKELKEAAGGRSISSCQLAIAMLAKKGHIEKSGAGNGQRS